MANLLFPIAIAIPAFISTNIDDMLLLTLWFSQPNNYSQSQVIIGRYLGFTFIIIASIPGIFSRSIVSPEYLGLLGLFPLLMGVRNLFSSEKEESTEIQWVNLPAQLTNIINPKIVIIALVTIANGSDNIAIYLPIFANHNWIQLWTVIITFYVMVGLWCYLAHWLVNRSILASTINRNITQLIPWVYIFIGICIMVDSKTYKLLLN